MRLDSIKRIALVLACAGAIASCEETGLAPIPPGLGPLGAGDWFLNTVDDSVLGSTVATRFIGAAQERTVADSGRLTVNADGTYAERYWLRIFVTNVLDRSETVLDEGNWISTDTGYVFVSGVRARSFVVVPTDLTEIVTAEPLVFWTGAPRTIGVYRRTRP